MVLYERSFSNSSHTCGGSQLMGFDQSHFLQSSCVDCLYCFMSCDHIHDDQIPTNSVAKMNNEIEYVDPSALTIIGHERCKIADDLRAKYPAIFSQPCEISILEGWIPLIDTLCYLIQRTHDLNDHLGYTQIMAGQVKQKLGGLRFYIDIPKQVYPNDNAKWTNWEEWVRGAVALAESIAGRTCEECGNPGKRECIGGYLYTSCETHKRV